MAGYLTMQIIKEKLSYSQVVEKFPQYKDAIDEILTKENREDLIVK